MRKMIYIVILLSAVSVYASVFERNSQKQARKAKILELLQESSELGNDEVRNVLRVSCNTVIRCMNGL